MSVDANSAPVHLLRENTGCVLALRGDLNLDLARRVHDAALEAVEAGGNLIVDCTEATHIDGSAAQVLLALEGALEQGGRSLQIRGASDGVRKYLGWSGLGGHFVAADSRPAAAGESPAVPKKRRRSNRKSPA